MALEAGTRLGHYEVLSSLGAGGMGEVYRARDTKLGREVAIKLLLEEVSQDAERLARFEREARVLASLNHNNIATLHGFESEGDTSFLVMELVEGETLADRIKRGAIPVQEALPLFLQIAEGLEAAHEKGIVHRDLKPANIKVTDGGQVKILDFGLAKATEPDLDPTDATLSNSPTLTLAATMRGQILGTAAYMAPEQAKGSPVDKRADLWAFGACLYEAITAKRAFDGNDATDILGSVLKLEPDWNALPSELPDALKRVLERCLAKDPRQRARDAGDLHLDLATAQREELSPSSDRARVGRSPMDWIPWLVSAGAVSAALAVWNLKPESIPAPGPVSKLSIALPENEELADPANPLIALSPNGTHVVFAGSDLLHLRALDDVAIRPLPGTEGGVAPFFSPNGEWVGFFAGNRLKKISIQSGVTLDVCDVETPGRAQWTTDGIILFDSWRLSIGVLRVPAGGGTPVAITKPEGVETLHRDPWLLPGGRWLLLRTGLSGISLEAGPRIVVLDLETGERRVLLEGGTSARYLPSGHIVYEVDGTLFAVPFDLETLQLTGPASPIVQGIMHSQELGHAQFSVSDNGSLAYFAGSSPEESRSLVQVDRAGQNVAPPSEARPFLSPRLSPDGRSAAVTIRDQNIDVWTYDLARGVLNRATTQPLEDETPAWSPDGARLVVASALTKDRRVLRSISLDGSGEEEVLMIDDQHSHVGGWSPNGRSLTFDRRYDDLGTGYDLFAITLGNEPATLLQTDANESMPSISPDGDWLSYMSDATGQSEIYVRPFTTRGPAKQVSIGGGEEPVWAANGELFYRNGERMMVIVIATKPALAIGSPQVLFERRVVKNPWPRTNYDVRGDGQLFIMVEEALEPPDQIDLVLNWFEELERLAPTH